jgi:hypothetical protein
MYSDMGQVVKLKGTAILGHLTLLPNEASAAVRQYLDASLQRVTSGSHTSVEIETPSENSGQNDQNGQ